MSQPWTDPQQPDDPERVPSAPALPVEETGGGLVDPRRLIPGPGEPPLLLPEPPTPSGPEEDDPDEHQTGG